MTKRLMPPLASTLGAFCGVLFLLCQLTPSMAQVFETKAKQALLFDATTGSVLLSKNADDKIPPASLAKLMTMEVVFNALSTGQLALTDEFIVSENAWRNGGATSGGSTMFAELNSSIAVEDLIRGVIVQSGNDSAMILAEGIAGTESAFASLMNQRARQIGLENSVFTNSTGLPDPNQHTTMRDLVKLAAYIQKTYPVYYRYYSEPDFTWNGIRQRNRNPLLPMEIGADGMKTGYTEESGYAIVGSTLAEGRRMIVAMSGMASIPERAAEARKILEWGRRAFEPMSLFSPDDELGAVRLYGGAELAAPVGLNDDLVLLVPLGNRDRISARIVYQGPIRAPIQEGDEVATLRIMIGDELAMETPLFAKRNVEKGPIHRQALDAATELFMSLL